MNGNIDWEKEKIAEQRRHARQVQATAEDIIERMRGLEMGLNLMGRTEDMMAVEKAIEAMEKIVRGAN